MSKCTSIANIAADKGSHVTADTDIRRLFLHMKFSRSLIDICSCPLQRDKANRPLSHSYIQLAFFAVSNW